jgi:hypothetical protein
MGMLADPEPGETVSNPLSGVSQQLKDAFAQPLQQVATAMVQPWQQVADALANSWQQISQALAAQWQEMMSTQWQEMLETYRQQLEQALSTATTNIPAAITGLAEDLNQNQQQMAPLVQEALGRVAAQAAEVNQNLIDQINIIRGTVDTQPDGDGP